MDLYYSPIVRLLTNNIGISRTDLYKISGIENKRDFLTEMNRLLADKRILIEYSYEYIRGRYSPKTLSLWVHEKNSYSEGTEYKINFIPTAVLEKDLEYVNNGTEQEDCLEFELQIAGYTIKEKHKAYFENLTGRILDFDKNNYSLWGTYLYPF
ncbi:MAG: hypothetical protein ABIN74_14420 [Ferruginibacter sp.]